MEVLSPAAQAGRATAALCATGHAGPVRAWARPVAAHRMGGLRAVAPHAVPHAAMVKFTAKAVAPR
jgi:hypothetical protein